VNTEDAASLRGQLVRAVVHSINDTGGSQALVVETHEGVIRTGVEVLQPYGLASKPAAGGLTVLLAIGGDQGDMVALPAAGGARLGVEDGEAALYTDEGTRVHLRGGGLVEIAAAASVEVVVGGTRLRVTASGIEITGNLSVTGNINATGNVSDGVGNLR
jgi:phage gp45-like